MKLQLIHRSDYIFALKKADDKLVLNAVVNENLEVITTKMVKWNEITHHLPLNNAPVLEGIELLPPLEDEVKKLCPCIGVDFRVEWINGYNKSQETHPFTEEDMVEFHKWLLKEQWFYHFKHNEFNNPFGEIKSTKELLNLWKEQQPKLSTAFDTETKQYIYATHN